MKSKLIVIVLTLFVGSVLVTTGSSASKSTVPAAQVFAISKNGTLLEVFDSNGKNRFGRLVRDGFQVTYESPGKRTTVSALGAEEAKGLQSGQVKVDEKSATVTVMTSDQALEITSYFTLDEKENRLIILRRFRNVSPRTVTVRMMRDYIDPALLISVGTAEYPLNKITDPARLAALVKSKIEAGRSCKPLELRSKPKAPPICLVIHCPNARALEPAHLGAVCDEDLARMKIILEWRDIIRLAAPSGLQPGSAATRGSLKNETDLLVYVNLK